MSTFNLIKASFTQPSLLLEARHKKGGAVFWYMILLAAILAAPIIYEVTVMTQSLKKDSTEIVNKLPDFSITDGTLTTDKKDAGFIYQTDSIIFTFDPDGERTKKELETDASGNAIVVGLLQHEAVIILPQVSASSDLLDSTPFTIPYTTPQMSIVNKSFIEALLAGNTSGLLWFSLIGIISLSMVFFNFLIDIILLTIFANLFSKLRLLRLTFKDNFKIIVYCSTLPTVLTALLQLIWPTLSFGSVGLAVTLLIYFNVLPKRVVKK